MKGGRPALVCAGLALAAHAALLLGTGHAGRHGTAGATAVEARYVTETTPAAPADVQARSHEPSSTQDAAPPPAAAMPATTAKAEAAGSDVEPPVFEAAALPRIGFPDAPMPDEGVQLRAYVELEADGSPRLISTASAPGHAAPPLGFQKLTEYGIRQARFKPGSGPAYCLLVRFAQDAPAPTLAWLPGAARDASRCLAGTAPPPRDLDVAPAGP